MKIADAEWSDKFSLDTVGSNGNMTCKHKAGGYNIEVWNWPSAKLPFDCQKIVKNLTFFQKKMPKIFIFFPKIANGKQTRKNVFLDQI